MAVPTTNAGSASRRLAALSKPALFVAAAAPLVKLALDAARDQLSANPIAEVMNRLGFWTLTLLLASLLATPLKAWFGWTWCMRSRRMLGLFSFFYACLHLVTYLALDQTFDLAEILRDVVKRKFITVGFAAFLLLVPLAVTSSNRWVKRLGFARWKALHRLAYAAAVLGVLHFVWRVKADLLQPAIFATVLSVLLLARLVAARRSARSRADGQRAAPPNVDQRRIA
jgi:sulfoxide reductase heme-binding subunit YedZ